MAQTIGAGLPGPLAAKLAAGGWLRTAHQGAPTVAPGNSRGAIDAAVALGVDMVEVDVHRTADGHLVLCHDAALHAGDTSLSIAAATLAAVRAVDIGQGEHVLTLAEGMETVRGRAALFVDLKADGLGAAIVETAQRLAFTPLAVCGRYRASLSEIKRLDHAVGTSLTLPRGWETLFGPEIIERADTDAFTVDHRVIDAAFVTRCHAAGRAVLAWTVDAPDRMRELLTLGADGLTSNRPDLF